MDWSTPGLPIPHHLLEFTLFHVHWIGDASYHLILCRPLLLLPAIFPSTRVFFQRVGCSHQVAKVSELWYQVLGKWAIINKSGKKIACYKLGCKYQWRENHLHLDCWSQHGKEIMHKIRAPHPLIWRIRSEPLCRPFGLAFKVEKHWQFFVTAMLRQST